MKPNTPAKDASAEPVKRPTPLPIAACKGGCPDCPNRPKEETKR